MLYVYSGATVKGEGSINLEVKEYVVEVGTQVEYEDEYCKDSYLTVHVL